MFKDRFLNKVANNRKQTGNSYIFTVSLLSLITQEVLDESKGSLVLDYYFSKCYSNHRLLTTIV